jgi:PAS domain-containing protein
MQISNVISLNDRQVADRAEAVEQFESRLQEAPVPLAVLDLSGAATMLSRGWRQSGLDVRLDQAFAPGDISLNPLDDAFQACLRTGQRQACRVEATGAAAGRWFTFDLNPWPQDGTPTRRVILSGRDITEVVVAAREAEEARAYLTAALANIPHGLCMFDAQARLILCNPVFAAMYRLPEHLAARGAPRADIIAYCLSIGSAPIAGADHYLAQSAVAAAGELVVAELELADGRTIRVTHTPSPAAAMSPPTRTSRSARRPRPRSSSWPIATP